MDAIDPDTARADAARAKLLTDLRELKQMGNNMIEKTETAIDKTPMLLGLGAVGVALVGVAIFAGRRSKRVFPGFPRERSFLAEAARSAALSALGIITGRITQRLLTSAMNDATRPATGSATHEKQKPRASSRLFLVLRRVGSMPSGVLRAIELQRARDAVSLGLRGQ